MRNLSATVATGFLLAGCTQGNTASLERFRQDGRIIALSGADAGAANACFTCHGLDGRGDGAGSPRLAGLHPGYLERQLEAYADGRRDHAQMGWIAKRLQPADRRLVASHYARLGWSPRPSRPGGLSTLYHEGSPSRGLPACATCHGEQGQGVGPANPPLAGQPAAYLTQQLDLWRKGKRRNDPGDAMLRISQLLTPAESRSVAAYASALAGDPPSPGSPEASREGHRGDPRSGVSGPPLHVPESARAAE